MKIGILTLPLHTNYGGILQAYALQTVLERMGHDVKILFLQRHEISILPFWKRYFCYIKRLILKYILKNKAIRVFHENYEKETFPIIKQETYKFIKKYIHIYQVSCLEEIGNDCSFDAYIVGSDQIWRTDFLPWNIEDSFLRFDKRTDTIKIAYAASFGVDTWEFTPEQTQKCIELAQRFDIITVREKSSISLCRYHLGINAKWVLDPTMLLDVKDYCHLTNNTNFEKSEGILFVYILDKDNDKDYYVNSIANERKLIPVIINDNVNNRLAPLEERIHPPVEIWLKRLLDAEYILTDSFHGCVFSILFHKPFIVLSNEKRGKSRIDSILDMFDLKERLITQTTNTSNIINKHIDWEKIDNILMRERRYSLDILTKYLR